MTPMSPEPPVVHHKEHNKWVYVIAAIVAVVLAIVLLATFTERHHSTQANAKASALTTKLVAAGYGVPDQDTIVALLGTDGGAVCKHPTGDLSKATWFSNMANGAGGPGARPVIADSRAVAAEAIVISVYCPEHLQQFQDDVQDLKTDTTVRT
jgi:hypothetical protein